MPVAWILRVLRASQIWTPSKQDDRALSANNVVSTETSATEKDFGYVSIVFHSNQILKPQVFGLREQGFLKANFSDTTASIIQKPEEHQSIWNMSLDIQRPKLRRWHLDSQNTPKLPHLRRDIFGCFSPIHLYIVSCFHHVCSKNISHLWTISKNHGKALKTRGYITPKNETNVGNPQYPDSLGQRADFEVSSCHVVCRISGMLPMHWNTCIANLSQMINNTLNGLAIWRPTLLLNEYTACNICRCLSILLMD